MLPLLGELLAKGQGSGPQLDALHVGVRGYHPIRHHADCVLVGPESRYVGAISTAVGIGAALSQVIAGGIVHQVGYHAGFPFLAGAALAAFAILYFFMPETRNLRLATE